MNKEHRELYKKAIAKWSGEVQLSMLEEECLELALAVKHYRRKRTDSFEHLMEEMADVEILLEQIKVLLCFGTDKYAFRTARARKFKKFKKMLAL